MRSTSRLFRTSSNHQHNLHFTHSTLFHLSNTLHPPKPSCSHVFEPKINTPLTSHITHHALPLLTFPIFSIVRAIEFVFLVRLHTISAHLTPHHTRVFIVSISHYLASQKPSKPSWSCTHAWWALTQGHFDSMLITHVVEEPSRLE